jgi:hypothetical protein
LDEEDIEGTLINASSIYISSIDYDNDFI